MIFQVTASGRPKPGRLLSFKPFGVQICRWAFLNIWGNTEPQAPSPDLGRMQGRGGGDFLVPHHLGCGPQLVFVSETCLPVPHEGFGAAEVEGEGKRD